MVLLRKHKVLSNFSLPEPWPRLFHRRRAKTYTKKGSAPQTPRSLAHSRPTPVARKSKDRAGKPARPSGVQPTAGRSGRTPAEPYPPNGRAKVKRKRPYRPAENYPWRNFLLHRNVGHF